MMRVTAARRAAIFRLRDGGALGAEAGRPGLLAAAEAGRPSPVPAPAAPTPLPANTRVIVAIIVVISSWMRRLRKVAALAFLPPVARRLA